MPPRTVRYFFGRLNILPVRSGDEKEGFLRESLEAGGTIVDHNIRWSIFQVSVLQHELGRFICGYLGRYKEETEIEIARPEGQVEIQTIENLLSAKTPFFLHIK